MRRRWQNWAHTETAEPTSVAAPGYVDELAETVRHAAQSGRKVKPVGAGHSFSGIAVTHGVQINLSRLAALVSLDTETGLVAVEAGMRLYQLNELLADYGLALPNLGDVDQQTVAGALSTGTHGTGARFGGLASQVRGLDLVLADGGIVSCSANRDPELFAAARVGLGALGVIATVTLQTVPAFLLRARETPAPLAEVLRRLDELVASHDHVEFYWFPHTERTYIKRNDRPPLGTPKRPPHVLRRWLDDELLSNTVYKGVNRLGATAPIVVPRSNALASRVLSARDYVDDSYRVFSTPRRVVFRESEWAIPRAAVTDALQEIRGWIDGSGERIAFPVEVRFAPAEEDIWLSTAHGRETAYIAVHQYHRLPHERYFNAVQEIMRAYEGRPHWGKLHTLHAERLRRLYPRFDDFLRLRDTLDPNRAFTNPYLDRVLGP